MNIQQLYEFCYIKKGLTEHFPFDEDTLVFKVGGKMFALTSLSSWEKGVPTINLKCNPEYALELRLQYEDINPGYHQNKTHWNTVSFNGDVPDKLICELINHSYELVFKSLPKNSQNTII